MARSSFDLTGTDQLLATLRRKSLAMSKRIESKALRSAGQVIGDEMSERASRSDLSRAYHLQDNIRVSNVRRKDGVKYVLVGPNKHVSWRAHFDEWGTSTQAARPFAEPAFLAKRKIALQTIADELRKGLRA